MSDLVKNAIDTGLMGLCVTENDVAAILRRARAEGAPARREPRQERRVNWRLSLALAVVLLVLVTAVGLRLVSHSPQDMTPLQPQVTEVPAGFVPVEDGAEPAVNLTAAEAVAAAERHIYDRHGETADLRDGAAYEITCEYVAREAAEGEEYRNFYAVHFRALTAEGTEYTLRISAEDGSVISCELQRGVGVNHTAQEIWAGYARVYGPDPRLWTQEQLRTCCQSLRKAESGSLRWQDYLCLLSSYPDVAEDAMTRQEIIAWTMADLDLQLYEYDRQYADMPRWKESEVVGEPRARYIGAYPNPVWQVAVDQRVVNQDGYEFVRTVLIEVDSVTGAVKSVEAVDASYAFRHEGFTRATVDSLMATTTNGGDPMLREADYHAAAQAHVSSRWGETRDITDESLFTFTKGPGDHATIQCTHSRIYRSIGGTETTEYVLYIDSYGDVVASGRSVTPAGRESFTPVAPALGWWMENLLDWQARAAASDQAGQPEVQVFIGTVWLDDYHDGVPNAPLNAALRAVNARSTSRVCSVIIDAEPNPVVKLAMETDQGNFLIEVDSVTCEIIHVQRVNSLDETWYLPFVLTADLRAAGVPIAPDVQPVFPTEATDDHGATDGMRIDHAYDRFKKIYGPDMTRWTPEQLRSFQSIAVISCDYDYDLGVPCLRDTFYPDIPANAITPQAAAEAAIAPIGVQDGWRLAGAVLIGTKDGSPANGTPVWKVCLQTADGSFWYAEVNCMTGKIYRLHQDADGAGSPGASYDYGTPQNLWFRDIVLEDTIEDCDATWECRGNG